MAEDVQAAIKKSASKVTALLAGTRKAGMLELKTWSVQYGNQMVSYVPAIAENLKDGDIATRAIAAELLADIGRFDAKTIYNYANSFLSGFNVPLSTPESYSLKGHCARALGHIANLNLSMVSPLTNQMIEVLKPPTYLANNPAPHQAALYAGTAYCLGNIVDKSPAYVKGPIPAISVAAKCSDLAVRAAAMLALETIAIKHPDYVAPVISAATANLTYPMYRADNSTPQMDRLYISSLFVIGKVAQVNTDAAVEAVPAAVSALRDTYVFAQWCSPQAIANKGGMRQVATNTVKILQMSNPAALAPVLVERLSEERDVGQHMESVFLAIAKDRPEVVAPYILQGLNKPSPLVRQRFIKAVGNISQTRPELVIETLPIIIEYLKDRDRFLRQAAVFALGGIGKGSHDHIRTIIPGILKAFDDTYENVQLEAIQALEEIWLKNPASMGSAIHALSKCLNAPHENIRQRALLALQRMQISVDEYLQFVREMDNTKKILEEAQESGTSTKPAEEMLRMAFAAVEARNWNTAIRYVKEAGENMRKLQMSSRPILSLTATTPQPLAKGQLVEVTLRMENVGSSRAKQIRVALPDQVEVSGMGLIPPIDPGKTRNEVLSMRPTENLSGLTLQVKYFDNDNLEYNMNVDVMVTSGTVIPQMMSQTHYVGSKAVVSGIGGGRAHQVTGNVDFSTPEFRTSGTRKGMDIPQPGAQETVQPKRGSAAPGMKFCVNCSAEIPNESVFCFKCGQPQRK
jgi:hypothetical protein